MFVWHVRQMYMSGRYQRWDICNSCHSLQDSATQWVRLALKCMQMSVSVMSQLRVLWQGLSRSSTTVMAGTSMWQAGQAMRMLREWDCSSCLGCRNCRTGSKVPVLGPGQQLPWLQSRANNVRQALVARDVRQAG